MSRSRRAPVWKDGGKHKGKTEAKAHANDVVKHAQDVPSGGAYKKFSDTWSITDWRCNEDHLPLHKRSKKAWKLRSK
jgi:hypothetical protein